jgi:hypothetical protein
MLYSIILSDRGNESRFIFPSSLSAHCQRTVNIRAEPYLARRSCVPESVGYGDTAVPIPGSETGWDRLGGFEGGSDGEQLQKYEN